MTESEVVKLFRAITLSYPAFRVRDDMAREQVMQWHEHLKDVPLSHAMENFRRHVRTEKYPPTIADLRRPIETKSPETDYHENLRRESEKHFAAMEQYRNKAVPLPDHIREEVKRLAARRDRTSVQL